MDDIVETLLQPMDKHDSLLHHRNLVCRISPNRDLVEVVQDVGGGKGKGVVATSKIQAGSRIFSESPLVGEQHVANQPYALICTQSGRYIGPLELQLGFRLLKLDQTSELPSSDAIRETALGLLSGTVQMPIVDWQPLLPKQSVRMSQIPWHLHSLLSHCGYSPEDRSQEAITGDEEPTLLGNAIKLPDGSDWMFASHESAALAWVTWAAALSPGPQENLPEAVRASTFVETFDPAKLAPSVQHACSLGGCLDTFPPPHTRRSPNANLAMPSWLGDPADSHAVQAFYEHAANSNDIFRVAARAIALIGSAACMFEAACATGQCQPAWQGESSDMRSAALKFAWQPFKAITKAIWWEHVPMPPDLVDEVAWREDLREMACDSLELLRAAVPTGFPQEILDERIWGSIIGMFELNNLAMQVQSPLELYFLACADLPELQRTGVLSQTSAWLDALDKDYDMCVEGTALYCLQSCMNHSQDPNAQALKEDYDMDGNAVICAKRDIAAGEEICISYIDLDAPEADQRQALLDYGITLA